MAFKTNEREVFSQTVNTVVPAASGDVDVQLGPGSWKVAVYVTSTLVDGETTVINMYALGPNDEEPNLPLTFLEQDDTTAVTALTLTDGAITRYIVVTGEGLSIQASGAVTIASKLRFTITKGNGVTGEPLALHIVAVRVT